MTAPALTSFPLAPMDGRVRLLSVGLLALSGVLVAAGAVLDQGGQALAGASLGLLCAAVWLLARPGRLSVEGTTLVLTYPLFRRRLPLQGLVDATSLSAEAFRQRFGWALRVGVGGLFGGFGWLRTSRGWVEMAIAGAQGMVLLEWRGRTPLLVTPAAPERFLELVRGAAGLPEAEARGSPRRPSRGAEPTRADGP